MMNKSAIPIADLSECYEKTGNYKKAFISV